MAARQYNDRIASRTFARLERSFAVLAAIALLFAILPCQALAGEKGVSDVGDGGLTPFYDWRSDLPDEAGKIMDLEALPPEFSLAGAGRAFRVLYSSVDGTARHGIVQVSGAVFLPRGEPPPGGWPLVAWAHGTTGIADVCAPSARPRGQRDDDYLSHWLEAGFAVVASDYQGLGVRGIHPYSNYQANGQSVLDAARAVMADPRFGVSGRMILMGHSQGAGVAIAAAGYAQTYAPDLPIMGVVITGTPNLTREAIESGLSYSAHDVMVTGAYTMIGFELARIHGGKLAARETFTGKGLEIEPLVGMMCLRELMEVVSERKLDPAAVFRPGALDRLWATDVPLRAYPALDLPVPIFMGIGLADTASLPMTAMALVNSFCENGTTVVARLYRERDHSGILYGASSDAIDFAMSILAGKKLPATCLAGGQP